MMNPGEIAMMTGGTVTERAIAILIAAGMASNKAIAEALGITPRAVQKARKATKKRTTVREPQFAEANHSSQNEPQDANHSSPDGPPPPKRKVSPCTPSKENNPLPPQNLTETFGFVSAGAAPKSDSSFAGKRYAFEGELIRVTEQDFAKWREAYSNIADLTAELRLADAYYAERREKLPGGKWFFAVSRWLDRANKEVQAAKKAEAVNTTDPYYARMVRLGMSRSEYERTYPPEIYRGLQ